MALVNRQITLVGRPEGYPKVSDFHLVYTPVPSPRQGEVLVRAAYLSLDPRMRIQMNDGESSSSPHVAIGGVMSGGAVGLVVESRDPDLHVGDAVVGILGWQEYAVADGGTLRKVDPELAPISTALGVLGLPGLTAYFGLLDVCDPHRGETVVVSEAAGAIGMIAGQIAGIRDCRVVGLVASGVELDGLVADFGFDGTLDCASVGDLPVALGELCPDGVDAYFDCAGGAVTDAVLRRINAGARVAICGQVSQYNLEEPEPGPRWLEQLIVKQAKVQGFQVSSCARRFPEGLEQLARWLQEGKLKYQEAIAQGIEAAPRAFIEMLRGRSRGQQLVRLVQLASA